MRNLCAHMSSKGVCASACEHSSLHVTLEALNASFFPWASSTQVVQVGHWASTKRPYKDYVAVYGNPSCEDLELRRALPLGTVLVATELVPGSFALFDTAPMVALDAPSEKRYKASQSIWYPLKASAALGAKWTPGPPDDSVIFHGVPGLAGHCRLASWQAQDFLVRQSQCFVEGLKIAWHMIFLGLPFGPPRGPNPVEAFEARDLYWSSDEDKFTPKDHSEDPKLCAECKPFILGHAGPRPPPEAPSSLPAPAPGGPAAPAPFPPLAPAVAAPPVPAPSHPIAPAASAVTSRPPHLAPATRHPVDSEALVGGAPIGLVLNIQRPFAPSIQTAVDRFGPRAILYVASRGPLEGGPPDFHSPEMTHQPRVTFEALQGVILDAYQKSLEALSKCPPRL